MHPQHLVSASGATRLFGGLLLGWLLTGGIFVLMLLALPGLHVSHTPSPCAHWPSSAS